MKIPEANLLMAWIGILFGFISGLGLGLNFHRDDWLGGYGSWKRRLYRLAHISFFGLAVMNLMFYFTARALLVSGPATTLAAWGFILGAISMPVCCWLMAHNKKAQPLFAIPVLSLLAGSVFTLWKITQL
jgi:hypothetical protein